MVRPLTLLLAALLAPVSALAAQQGDSVPIGIGADPRFGLAGSSFALEGTSAQYGKTGRLKVTISPPERDSAPIVMTLIIGESGEFHGRTPPLRRLGTWRIHALAPDGKGQDTTSVRILTWEEYADEIADDWEETEQAADSALRIVKRALDKVPMSPPRQEAQQKLEALQRELANYRADRAKVERMVASITAVPGKRPEAMPAFEPVLRAYGSWREVSRRERDAQLVQLAASARQGEGCEAINTATEGIKVASAFINLGASAIGIASAFFKDWLADRAQQVLPASVRKDPALTLAAQEMVKNGQSAASALEARYGSKPPPPVMEGTLMRGTSRTEAALERAAGMVPGLAYDLAGLLVAKLFDKYCEKFEGPLEASLHVEFLNEAGKVYWTYDIAVAGKLVLRYAKGQSGQAVRVRGEVIGSGTDFKLWENILPTLDPKLMAGNVTWKRYHLPMGVPFVELEGAYIGAMGPRAFFIPVEGDLVGQKLTLRFQPARTDFDGVEARGIYVIAGLRTMGLPIVLTVPFPYKGGHFVITRAADARDRPVELAVRIPPRTNTMVAESTFVRDKVKGDGNVASYRMSLKVCNPGC